MPQFKNILIVDDEDVLARNLQAHFRRHGWGAWMAVTGNSAVIAAEQLRPGIILLDYHLPDMNGFEVLQAIRVRHCCACILMTGHPEDVVLADAGRHGVAHVLTKPFSMAALELKCLATAVEFSVMCSKDARPGNRPGGGAFATEQAA